MLLRAVLIAVELSHIEHYKPNTDTMSPSAISVATSQQRVADLIESLPSGVQMQLNGYPQTRVSPKYLENNTTDI